MVPQAIGQYELIEEVGRGGMGVVYRAHDPELRRIVALKVLFQHLEGDAAAVGRFRRGAEVAARLRHPNIVTLHNAQVSQPPYCIAMEFLGGRSLDKLPADGGRLDPNEVVDIISQVCAALDHAHERRFMHRDVKPSNIMVDDSGKATLMDFDIARPFGQTSVTMVGTAIGSADFMSPEQARDDKDIDHRTDIYSLGAVLYAALTGRPPFIGNNPLTVMHQIVHELPKRPSVLDPGISPALDAVVMRALEKDPARRFQSAGEMARHLRQAVLPAPPAETKQGQGPGSTPKWVLAVTLAVVVSLIGVILYFVLRHDGPGPGLLGVTVPYLVDLPEAAAQAALKERKLVYGFVDWDPSPGPPGVVVKQEPAANTACKEGDEVKVWLRRAPKTGPKLDPKLVPGIEGLSYDRAKAELNKAGLKWTVRKEFDPTGAVARGFVLRQSPQAGQPPSPNRTVVVTLSLGIPCKVPPLKDNKTLAQARQALQRASLSLGHVQYAPTSDPRKEGKIKSCKPGEGEDLPRGDPVNLVIYVKAPAPATVPRLKGLTLAQATRELKRAALARGTVKHNQTIDPRKVNRVQYSDPPDGTKVARGSLVTLYVGWNRPQPPDHLLKCPKCTLTFKTESELNQHLRKAHGYRECSDCRKLLSRGDWEQHRFGCYYTCPVCVTQFGKDREKCKNHLATAHPGSSLAIHRHFYCPTREEEQQKRIHKNR